MFGCDGNKHHNPPSLSPNSSHPFIFGEREENFQSCMKICEWVHTQTHVQQWWRKKKKIVALTTTTSLVEIKHLDASAFDVLFFQTLDVIHTWMWVAFTTENSSLRNACHSKNCCFRWNFLIEELEHKALKRIFWNFRWFIHSYAKCR